MSAMDQDETKVLSRVLDDLESDLFRVQARLEAMVQIIRTASESQAQRQSGEEQQPPQGWVHPGHLRV
jgi:hypothetical protein